MAVTFWNKADNQTTTLEQFCRNVEKDLGNVKSVVIVSISSISTPITGEASKTQVNPTEVAIVYEPFLGT